MGSDLIDDAFVSDLVDDPKRSAAVEPRTAALTARRRRRWAEQAALAAGALGGIGSFVALTRAIASRRGNAVDRAIVRQFGRVRSPLTDVVARSISAFGSVLGATGISVTTVAIAIVRRRPRLASQIAVGALGGVTAELGLKRRFLRERPRILGHLEKVHSTSFPSGHAMAAATLYLTLAFVASRSPRLRPRRVACVVGGGGLATSVGVSRVYLGVHWPTDVLGGLALGTAWACLTEAAFDLAGAERIEREAKRDHVATSGSWRPRSTLPS